MGVGDGGAAGIRGRRGLRKADDSMDPRQAAVLLLVLLLVTDWGHAEGPGGWDGAQLVTVGSTPIPWHHFPLPQCEICSRCKHSSGQGLHGVLTSEQMAPQPPTT